MLKLFLRNKKYLFTTCPLENYLYTVYWSENIFFKNTPAPAPLLIECGGPLKQKYVLNW